MNIIVHVLPVDDLIQHQDSGDDCPCGPRVKFTDGGMVVVHHSLDGREKDEVEIRINVDETEKP